MTALSVLSFPMPLAKLKSSNLVLALYILALLNGHFLSKWDMRQEAQFSQLLTPCCAEFIGLNMNTYFHFLLFFNSEMTHVVPRGRQKHRR